MQDENTFVFVIQIVVISGTIKNIKKIKTIMDINVTVGMIEFGNICINFNCTLYIYKIV